MPKLVLLNDNIEQNNWGAQATPTALRKMLHDHIPNLTVQAFSYSWLIAQWRRWKGPFRIVRPRGPMAPWRFTESADKFPDITDEFDYYADEWQAGRGGPMGEEFLAALSDADMLVHNGEHSFYRNTREGCRAAFLLWLAKTRLNKPACEINHTAHLTTVTPILYGMVKRVFPILDLLTARELCTYDAHREMGITNVELAPDVVYYLDPKPDAEAVVDAWLNKAGLRGKPFFCLSSSALPVSKPKPNWEGKMVELIRRLKRIIPNAVLMAKDAHCQFFQEIARMTDSVFFGPEHSFWELWPLFQRARLLVTGHYHYIIMASTVGCPFIPMSTTTHKMTGNCRMLQWPVTTPYDITWLQGCMDGVLKDAQRFTDEHDKFSNALLERTRQLKHDTAHNARRIRGILEAARK